MKVLSGNTKMRYLKKMFLCLLFTVFLAGFSITSAQGQSIALHPFQGNNRVIAEVFFDVLISELYAAPVAYSIYYIDLEDLPPDVPAGGFPAHVCPSPSLTKGASYAITGEINDDPYFSGSYRLRLYLWEMSENHLLTYDELTARDRGSCQEQMSYLLPWILSWIGKEKTDGMDVVEIEPYTAPEPPRIEEPAKNENLVRVAEAQPLPQIQPAWDPSRWLYIGPKGSEAKAGTPADNTDQWVYLGPETEKWLYLGVRGGMGTSQWYFDPSLTASYGNQDITSFSNANLSLQLSLHVLRFFDIQTETSFNADFGSLANVTSGSLKQEGLFVNWSLTVPLLVKLNLRGSHLRAGIFGGVYLYLPLWQTNSDKLGVYFDYKPDLPGIVLGMSLGWKLGPGSLFLDSRFEYDGRWFSSHKDQFYYRNMVKFNIGYEMGFIQKKNG